MYSATITSASNKLLRDKVTIQALAEWTIELLRKAGKAKTTEPNSANSDKRKEKEVVKAEKAEPQESTIGMVVCLSRTTR